MISEHQSLSYQLIPPQIKKSGCYLRNPQLFLKPAKNHSPKTLVALPLKHIDYDIEVTNGLASTTLQQTYVNPTQKYLEIDFSFPIDPKVCIYKFTAQFGNKLVQGVVKEKEEAKKEYQEAISQGKQAVYAEIDQKNKDVMNMEIGNLAPGQELKVSISYLQELQIELNTFYQLQIPSTLVPLCTRIGKSQNQSVQGEYTWTFKITLLTSRKLTHYVSHTHKLEKISQNQQKTETILCLPQEEKPTRNFSLLFTVEDFHLPNYVLGRTDHSSTAMLSFIPKFCELSLDDAAKASMKKNEVPTDMSAVKGEYIFFLDRSGSMEGSRITQAKNALILFLKSLPEDTYFNVISFGSNWKGMFKKSAKYGKNTVEQAVIEIKKMDADMCSTEIYEPLEAALKSQIIPGYPKQLFLLTDGDVSNSENVISLVGAKIKYSRCHAIGIGNDCSKKLIQGCAQKGKGKHVFISDRENPSDKIIGLLEDTLTPVIDSVVLEHDKDVVQSIVPNPHSLPYILKNEIANFYITFKGQLDRQTSIKFSYKDSMNKLPFVSKIQIDPESQNMPFVDKMAQNKIIKNLQMAVKENKEVEDFMHYVKVVDKKKEAIDCSVKHQILSEYTAFICVNKEIVDGKAQEVLDVGSEKVKIEPIIENKKLKYDKYEEECSLYMNVPETCTLGSPIMSMCSSVSASKSKKAMLCDMQLMTADQMDEIEEIVQMVSRLKCQGKMISKDLEMSEKQIEQLDLQTDCAVNLSKRSKKSKSFFGSVFGAIGNFFSGSSQIREAVEKKPSNDKIKKNLKEIVDQVEDKKISVDFESKEKQEAPQPKPIKRSRKITIDDVVNQMQVDGSFESEDLLKELFPQTFKKILSESEAKNITVFIVVSYLVGKWIQIHHPKKQYVLIARKALNFVKKSMPLENLQFLDAFLN